MHAYIYLRYLILSLLQIIKQCNTEECRLLGYDIVRLLLEPTFRRNYRLHQQGEKNKRARSIVSSNRNVPSCLVLFSLMMEAIRSSDTSVLTRATGVESKKTIFIIAAVKTSNFT
jgi:hypothetical protein